jgi:hypothetical protein
MGNRKLIIILVILFLLGVFALGVVGGMQAKKIEATCDIGFGFLCWQWHKIMKGSYDTFENPNIEFYNES